MNGQAPLPRSLLHEHPGLFKDHALFTLLGKCLLEASWRPRTVTVRTGRGFQQVALAKGQFVFGRYEWAEALGMNASSCARRMSRLGTMGFLHLQTGTHFSVGTLLIPVCFERKGVTCDAPSDTPMTHQWATNGPPMGTTEEGKKGRREEEEKNTTLSGKPDPAPDEIPYDKIISMLNEHAGTSYLPKTRKTQSLIRARWNEGFRLPEFEKVIRGRCRKWRQNPDMVEYLRPETLFGTKFEAYLQDSGESRAVLQVAL